MKKPNKIPKAGSKSEAELALHLRANKLPHGLREYRFDDVRKWRFDFAWPEIRFAVEVEGLTGGAGGRHQRIAGFNADLEKYEHAMLKGWTVYRCSQAMISSGRAIHVIAHMLQALRNTNENTGSDEAKRKDALTAYSGVG